jgi:O-antigen/teichoic acid export membrane protein
MIWLLVTASLLAQPVMVQSPVPAPPAVLKFIPQLLVRRARAAAKRAFSASLSSSATIACLIGSVLIISPGIIVPFLGGSAIEGLLVQLSAVDVIVLVLGQVCLASVMSTGDMRIAGFYMILWSVFRYTMASVLLFSYAVEGVLVGWIVGDSLLLLIALRRAIRDLNGGDGSEQFSFPEFVRYSSYTLLSALLGYAINQADKLLTLAQQGLAQLAIYNVALAAASFAGLAPYALTLVLLPALSSLHASNQLDEIRRMVGQYNRYVSIIVTPIAFGFTAITGVVLRLFGSAYLGGFAPSAIVSITSGLTAVGAVYAAVLLAIGSLRWYTMANIVGVVSLALVAYFATPVVGLLGPALGRATLMVFATSLYAVALIRRRLFRIDAHAFIGAIVGAAPMGVIVFFILSWFRSFLVELAVTPIAIVVGAGLYLGILRGLKLLTTQDFEFLKDMAPARAQGMIRLFARLAGVNLR